MSPDLTIDKDSTLTMTDGILAMYGENAVTISSGGWLNITTSDGEDGSYYMSLSGNAATEATVTGTGSKLTITAGKMRVGRKNNTVNSNVSLLTIADGGLVMSDEILIGAESTGVGYVRMGPGGILAILGTKTLAQMTTLGAGAGELQYWTGSAWDDINNPTGTPDYTLTTYSTETFISGVDVDGYTVLTMAGGTPAAPAGTVIMFR